MRFRGINEEVINGKFYFYHSTKNLQAAKYIVEKKWRTNMGLYGDGIYGQQYADPLDPRNELHAVDRYKSMYGTSYRFKIMHKNPKDLFYLDLDAGKDAYGDKYDKQFAMDILRKHGVPEDLIVSIEPFFSTKNDTPPISSSNFAVYSGSDGILLKYGFNGLVYQGNQDGKCVVFWNANNTDLTVDAYSTDFGKSWISYDPNNVKQVNRLKAEIQAKIDELAPTVKQREQEKQQTGKTPLLKLKGKDRAYVRVIDAAKKAGYDLINGDDTSGDVQKFASIIQRQIDAAKEPKRTRRYEIAIEVIPEAVDYLTL